MSSMFKKSFKLQIVCKLGTVLKNKRKARTTKVVERPTK